MSRAVLCFDFDGTLVNSFGRIHPEDKALITDGVPGFTFIVCTGRSLESVRRTFLRNGLFRGGKIPIPLVLLNGSLIYDRDEEFLGFFPFQVGIQNEIILKAQQYEEITFLFLSRPQTYILGENPFGVSQIENYEFTPCHLDQLNQGDPISKVMCISDRLEALQSFNESIASIMVEKDFSMPTILELTPLQINKGFGLKKLLGLAKRADEQVFAAGDGENDLSLFSAAAESFVPIIAPQKIKERATHIIDPAERGVLAPMIERWHELKKDDE